MADYRSGFRVSWIAPATILAASFFTFSGQAPAEIIIDDFDDPFEIALPPTSADTRVVQSNIGPLGVERHSSLVSILARPAGRLDATISVASGLTFAVDQLNRSGSRAPVVSLNLSYYFPEIDITQGGVNDRVLVDFVQLQSTLPLARVSAFMHDPQTNFASQQFGIVSSGGRFTLAFPFDEFTERGGGNSQLDVTRIHSLYVSFTPVYFADVEQFSSLLVVDRIRFASEVPEPRAIVLSALGALIGIFRFRGGIYEKAGRKVLGSGDAVSCNHSRIRAASIDDAFARCLSSTHSRRIGRVRDVTK
jgi:hypothetical protein